jgi:hypothetical protein
LKLDGSNPTLLYGYGEQSSLQQPATAACWLCCNYILRQTATATDNVSSYTASGSCINKHSILEVCCSCCFLPLPPAAWLRLSSFDPVNFILGAVLLPGGFNISLEPGFSASRLAWLAGYNGVYAQVGPHVHIQHASEWTQQVFKHV